MNKILGGEGFRNIKRGTPKTHKEGGIWREKTHNKTRDDGRAKKERN